MELGISDHKLIFGYLQTKIRRRPSKIVKGRTFKKFNQMEFFRDVDHQQIFDDPDDSYWAWATIFKDISDRHARDEK